MTKDRLSETAALRAGRVANAVEIPWRRTLGI